MPKRPFTPSEVQIQQEKIMDCASQIMAEVGYHQLSMRRLAKLLNMTASNIYNYFINKEMLFLRTRRRGFELLSKCSHTAVMDDSVIYSLYEMSEKLISFAQTQPGYYQMIFQPPQLSTSYSLSVDMKLVVEVESIAESWQNHLMTVLAQNIVGLREASMSDKESILIAYFSGLHGLIDSFRHRALPVLKVNDQLQVNRLILVQVQRLIDSLSESIELNEALIKNNRSFEATAKDLV